MTNFSDIIVKRFGKSIDSHMVTYKIVQVICPYVNYKVLRNRLIPLPEFKITKPYVFQNEIPKYIEIENTWNDKENIISNNSNILGNFGRLETSPTINLPINFANKNNVNYYGAKLFNVHELIKFEFNKYLLPITYISIGQNYVKDYIQEKDLGGGHYLEYHDNPHYHSPLNSDNKGFIVLGKKVENKIRLSGFIIPWNSGLYTPGGIIHNDANLVGNWMVSYAKSKDYSTVLLRDKNDNCTKIIPQYIK